MDKCGSSASGGREERGEGMGGGGGGAEVWGGEGQVG